MNDLRGGIKTLAFPWGKAKVKTCIQKNTQPQKGRVKKNIESVPITPLMWVGLGGRQGEVFTLP